MLEFAFRLVLFLATAWFATVVLPVMVPVAWQLAKGRKLEDVVRELGR